MIRVVILYPNAAGKRFDFDYYLSRHMPMVQRLGSDYGLTAVHVSRINSALAPGAAPQYLCAATIDFDSRESVDRYLAANGAQIMGDIPNYTDIQPIIEFAEVLM